MAHKYTAEEINKQRLAEDIELAPLAGQLKLAFASLTASQISRVMYQAGYVAGITYRHMVEERAGVEYKEAVSDIIYQDGIRGSFDEFTLTQDFTFKVSAEVRSIVQRRVATMLRGRIKKADTDETSYHLGDALHYVLHNPKP